MNKKVIDLKSKDVRHAVPNGLSYFMVEFASYPGYAHVIEDEEMFPKNFAEVRQRIIFNNKNVFDFSHEYELICCNYILIVGNNWRYVGFRLQFMAETKKTKLR